MNTRNLMPVQRLNAKRKQRALRRWILIDATYLIVLAIVGAVCAALAYGGIENRQTSMVTADVKKSNATLRELRRQSAALKTQLQSITDVSGRPDWSLLLAALSDTLGDDVVLNGLDCTQDTPSPPASAATGDDTPREFRIGGIGRSQQAVTQFVIRLEDMKFFERVNLVQTAPQALRGHDCIGFHLICTVPQTTGPQTTFPLTTGRQP